MAGFQSSQKRGNLLAIYFLVFAALATPARSPAGHTDIAAADATAVAVSVWERMLLDAANRERKARRLPLLKWNAELAFAARKHAELMARRNELSHQFPEEPALPARAQAAGAKFSSVAENVAYGPSASSIHVGWMHSPHHRANLLDRESDSVGIAVVERSGVLFAVEDFAHALDVVSLPEQVREVSALLAARGLRVSLETPDAEQACASGHIDSGRDTVFVASYTTTELSRLPEPLVREVRTGRYHKAAVAACIPEKSDFSDYQIAVLLYP